jgi:hypothetical protein
MRRLQQVVFAAADGTMAAMSINRSLLARDWTIAAGPKTAPLPATDQR